MPYQISVNVMCYQIDNSFEDAIKFLHPHQISHRFPKKNFFFFWSAKFDRGLNQTLRYQSRITMGAQSKFFYQVRGRDPKEGGWDPDGDFHVWLVHKKTGKIKDSIQHAKQVKEICEIRRCDPNKPVYKEWGNYEFYYRKHIGDMMKMPLVMLKTCALIEGQGYGKCNLNACLWLKAHPEEADDWRIAIGSCGWKRLDGKGSFWEYG